MLRYCTSVQLRRSRDTLEGGALEHIPRVQKNMLRGEVSKRFLWTPDSAPVPALASGGRRGRNRPRPVRSEGGVNGYSHLLNGSVEAFVRSQRVRWGCLNDA